MDLLYTTTHVVVLFIATQRKKRKNLVDLVPKSWLLEEERRYVCLYPEESDYERVDDWVKNSKSPMPTWGRSVVKLLKEAASYEQGLRRLKRACENIASVESSTEIESCSDAERLNPKHSKTNSLTTASLKEAFENIPHFPNVDHVMETCSPIKAIGATTASQNEALEDILRSSNKDRTISSSTTTETEVFSSSDGSPSPKRYKKGIARAEEIPDSTPVSCTSVRKLRQAEVVSSSDESPSPKQYRKGSVQAEKSSGNSPLTHTKSKTSRRKLQLVTPNSKVGDSTQNGNLNSKSMEPGFTCCQENTQIILKKLKSMKRSFAYDMEKKFNSILDTLAINSDGKIAEDLSEVTTTLGVKLPIKTFGEFVDFDNSLKEINDKLKKPALMKLMLSKSRRAETWREAIGKILGSLMSKDVQLCYSGCGRKMKGTGKENLSETMIYKCMEDVLLDKYKDSRSSDIISKMSRWLAGAGDREGGKKERDEKAALEAALKQNAPNPYTTGTKRSAKSVPNDQTPRSTGKVKE